MSRDKMMISDDDKQLKRHTTVFRSSTGALGVDGQAINLTWRWKCAIDAGTAAIFFFFFF